MAEPCRRRPFALRRWNCGGNNTQQLLPQAALGVSVHWNDVCVLVHNVMAVEHIQPRDTCAAAVPQEKEGTFEEGQASGLRTARERALEAKDGKLKCTGVRREVKTTVRPCGAGTALEGQRREMKFNQLKQQSRQRVRCR